MNEKEFSEMLCDVLEELCDFAEEDFGFDVPELADAEVTTYEDSGVMSHNKGLVIRLASGEEFQLTIVRSR